MEGQGAPSYSRRALAMAVAARECEAVKASDRVQRPPLSQARGTKIDSRPPTLNNAAVPIIQSID